MKGVDAYKKNKSNLCLTLSEHGQNKTTVRLLKSNSTRGIDGAK